MENGELKIDEIINYLGASLPVGMTGSRWARFLWFKQEHGCNYFHISYFDSHMQIFSILAYSLPH